MIDRSRIERASLRLALALGFCGTLGLWLYTSHAFNQRVAAVREEAATLTARYTRAHELLSTATAHLLLSSVGVRDALLDPGRREIDDQRWQIEEMSRVITTVLDDYERVTGSRSEEGRLRRLRDAFARFHQTSMDVVGAADERRTDVRDMLNRRLVPRRDTALAILDEIQDLNRQAFERQQAEITRVHQLAEVQSRRQLGVALVLGLGTLLLTSLYVVKLEARLRMQLKRDVRLSRELYDTTTRLLEKQQQQRLPRDPDDDTR